MSKLKKEELLDMFRKMEDIRNFDNKINQMVRRGLVPGMTHFSVGEEAANVGAVSALAEGDLLTSNHRGHGQSVAMGMSLNEMMAEIMGRANGSCKGKGGSMHIADLDRGNLGANGIVGGGMGIATGAALTQKMKNTGKVVMCCFGDGASNEGAFHECINMCAIWKLPVIFYCINNGYGISTPITSVMNTKHVYERAVAYGIPGLFVEDGNDVLAVREKIDEAMEHVRSGKGPILVEAVTYRWFGHSTSDPGKYRTKEEVEEWKKKDPILKFRNYLIENKIADAATLDKIAAESEAAVEESVKFGMAGEQPSPESAFEDIFAE
ncbi:MAG: thiamine pyrophosphate-dependent dehydrogenase E1 component subunit alpha [Porphyromonadaceae bacterium]|nr:thiamine pyrophosphate-dependent dehydrogenase E1 component subunit alpha [Porphyromonadaceae bacterium]